MDRPYERWTFREGDDVYGADGDKVGSVIAVQPNHIVVEKGFFFPTDYYIPNSTVAGYDDGKVYLNVTKEAALSQGWDTEPTGDRVAETAVGTGYAADTGLTTDTYATGTTTDAYAAETARVDESERLRVPVHEEELAATKRPVERGKVRVEKDVVAEERTLEVPVTEERVRVSRVAVDRDATADEGAFEEGAIEVPVRGEEVELQKRTRVAEEVEVEKEAVRRTEAVGGTVRREEVRVAEDIVEGAAGDVRR